MVLKVTKEMYFFLKENINLLHKYLKVNIFKYSYVITI